MSIRSPGRRTGRLFAQGDAAPGDIDGQFPHPLQITIDLESRRNQTQILCDGLMQGQQPGHKLVDFDFLFVNTGLLREHRPRIRGTPLDRRRYAAVDRRLHQRRHFQ